MAKPALRVALLVILAVPLAAGFAPASVGISEAANVSGVARQSDASASAGHQTPPELMALAEEFRAWRRGAPGVPDYAGRFRDREQRLPDFQRRLTAIDPSSWPVGAQVDYLVLLVEMNQMAFDLKVTRPEFRNPDFYVLEAVRRPKRHVGSRYQLGPGVTVPYDAERAEAIIAELENTSAIVDQAPGNLTEGVPELAQAAIERLENVGEHYREFGRVVAQHVPVGHRERLTRAAATAGDAMESYRGWLIDNKPEMTGPYAIGLPAFEWHLQNVLVLPYDSRELLMQAEIERSRNWAFLQFERQKNRHLPGYDGPAFGEVNPEPLPVAPVTTHAEYSELKDATDVLSRLWARQYDLFTHPEDLGPMRVRPGGVHIGNDRDLFGLLAFPDAPIPEGEKVEFMVDFDHFFTQQYQEFAKWMDPGVNHPHSDYPGHTFEGWVSQRGTNEFRRGHNTRGDAWTFYVEELQLQLDYPFVRGPRVREWIYAISLWRVERIELAVRLAEGSFTPEEAVDYLNENIPWMTTFKSKRMEVWGSLANPTSQLKYQPTKWQLMKILAKRVQQLGREFNLRDFHDDLLATGQIPLALTYWEMTGDDSDVTHLWRREPIPVPASAPGARP